MKKCQDKIFGVVGLGVLALTLFCHKSAQALTFTTLHSFAGPPGDGKYPTAGLVADTAGNLYGMTPQGGSHSSGVVFKLNSAGKETVLYNFCSKKYCADGATPSGGLARDSSNNLYGTTAGGGSLGFGAVFKLNPTTRVETVLHSFAGQYSKGDGSSPNGSLWLDSASGILYGATSNGGRSGCAGVGCGTVFSVGPPGNETVLYRFTGGTAGGNPKAGVVRIGGVIYGTLPFGGSSQNGVVFEIASGIERAIYSFTGGADGGTPLTGGLLELGGALYGTTAFGGVSGSGVIFKLINLGHPIWKESVLGNLQPGSGCNPGYSGLIFDSILKYFYATTNSCGRYNFGTLLRDDMQGNIIVLHNFSGGIDGGLPEGSLLYRNGQLYGTTYGGGKFGAGAVFRLTP